MYLKTTIVAGALLISASAFAQQDPQKESPNYILGHGILQPADQQSWDYPPGHQMNDSHASLRSDAAVPERTAKSRNGTDGFEPRTIAGDRAGGQPVTGEPSLNGPR